MERLWRWTKKAARPFSYYKVSTLGLLLLDGKNLQGLPIEERKAKLEELQTKMRRKWFGRKQAEHQSLWEPTTAFPTKQPTAGQIPRSKGRQNRI